MKQYLFSLFVTTLISWRHSWSKTKNHKKGNALCFLGKDPLCTKRIRLPFGNYWFKQDGSAIIRINLIIFRNHKRFNGSLKIPIWQSEVINGRSTDNTITQKKEHNQRSHMWDYCCHHKRSNTWITRSAWQLCFEQLTKQVKLTIHRKRRMLSNGRITL